LTLDETDDQPFDWTPGSKAVIFISNRTGKPDIYRQRIDETAAEMLVSAPEDPEICRVNPYGTPILYLTSPDGNDTAKRSRGGEFAPCCLLRERMSGLAGAYRQDT
jgi:Tol biopolymer transport system component